MQKICYGDGKNIFLIKKISTIPKEIGKNTIIIEQLDKVPDFDIVFYTKIDANIDPLTAQNLAQLAIDSALSKAGERGLDGVSYLMQAKFNGIETPLMSAYEIEVLKKVGTKTLPEALDSLTFLKTEKRKEKYQKILK